MQERLIEHWLDSINERGYQQAFLQMLAGEGHTIVHSTRHMAIEFGKDVVSIDADGVPCAFQLKGNPGSRLTLSQFREIRGQIDELVDQPIRYPGIPDIPHKCYLVTNGEVEEEVQRAVDDLNVGYGRRNLHPNTRLHLISRGMLLDWAVRHSSTFWPESYSVHEKLIRFYNEDGAETIDLELMSQGLDAILKISSKDAPLGVLELERRQISASLFVTFAVRNFSNMKNHNSVAAAFASLFVTLECANERHGVRSTSRGVAAKAAARAAFISALVDLAEEMGTSVEQIDTHHPEPDFNKAFLSGGALADQLLWNARALSTTSLLCLADLDQMYSTPQIKLSPNARRAIDVLTARGLTTYRVWGDAAIPQILCLIFRWHLRDPSLGPNFSEYHLLNQVICEVLSPEKGYIASPYHSDEESIRDRLPAQLGVARGDVEREVIPHSSFFVEGLFHCFVRSNLKSYAKTLWPKVTKITHNSFLPKNTWEYALWRVEEGDNQSHHLEHRQRWVDVQRAAADIETPHIPQALRMDPVMLLAFTVYFPHRALPEVIRFLHFAICGTWFMPWPRPPREFIRA